MAYRTLLIIVAIFGLGWGASFGAGLAVGRRAAPPAQVAQAAPGPGGPLGQFIPGQGGAAPGGAGGQGGQARVATLGTVDHVDGQAVYVTGPNGQQVRVEVTDQTQIMKQVPGALGDLAAGARVAVQPQGQSAADGSLTAATITLLPEGAAGPRAGQGTGGQQRGGQQRAPGS